MKTQRGYIKFSLGASTWFFLEHDASKLGEALAANNLMTVIELSVLEIDKYGVQVSGRWCYSQVRDELSLANHIKRMEKEL